MMSTEWILILILLIFSSPMLCVIFLGLVTTVVRWIQSKIFNSQRVRKTFAHQHVVITGGSEGLGLALAKACVAAGAKVTILSRSQSKLDHAKALIMSHRKYNELVQAFSVDVTHREALHQVLHDIRHSPLGDIDIFFSCAGSAKTGKFTSHVASDYHHAMELNYMASIYACEYLYPHMTHAQLDAQKLQQQASKRICFIASALALTSYVGYAAYAPTKYALRGLADTLCNESQHVKIHIAYPGQMNTRGFSQEQQTKPSETLAIEAQDTLYEPDDVARMILESMSNEQFNIYCGAFEIQLLGIATAGLSPRSNAWLDMMVLPWTVLMASIVRYDWNTKVKKHHQANEQ